MANEVFQRLVDKRGAPTDSAWADVDFEDLKPSDIIRKKADKRLMWSVESFPFDNDGVRSVTVAVIS